MKGSDRRVPPVSPSPSASRHTPGLSHGLLDALRAEVDRAAFLEHAGARLGSSLHPVRTMRVLVGLAAPALADIAVVVLPVRGHSASWYRAGPDGADDSGAVPAEDLDRTPRVDEAFAGLPTDASAFPARELAGLAGPVPPDADLDGEALVLRLSGSGVTAGVLILLRGSERAAFREPDVELARRFAIRAGGALATAVLYAQQAQTTAVLQANLAPAPLPRVDGIALGAAYRPAAEALRISGDFYHVTPASDASGGVTFAFGDVRGMGTEAAVTAGLVRQSLRVLALTEPEPLRALRLLNRTLLDNDERFTTLVTGSARPSPAGGLDVMTAGGGHLPPLILRRDGRVETVEINGTLVGAVADPVFGRVASRLGPGELMLLYSDGLTEASGGPTGHELYGEDRLSRDLGTCRGMPAGAVAERVEILITQWLAGRVHDDIAVLAIQAPARPSATDGGRG